MVVVGFLSERRPLQLLPVSMVDVEDSGGIIIQVYLHSCPVWTV